MHDLEPGSHDVVLIELVVKGGNCVANDILMSNLGVVD